MVVPGVVTAIPTVVTCVVDPAVVLPSMLVVCFVVGIVEETSVLGVVICDLDAGVVPL